MRWIRIALFCVLCSNLAEATAIVAAVFPSGVYIAADSRLTRTAASGGPATSSEGCKIVQTPTAAFAVSALSSDSRTGFDFGAITRGALGGASGPLASRIDAVEAALAPGMKAAVEGIRQDFPKVYESFQEGKVGQAVFAAWEDGRPVLIEEDWAITAEGEVRQERFRATDEQNLLIIGSGGDAVLRFVNQNADWWKAEPAEALERLIEAAIEDAAATHADDVGGDVSILKIDASGQRWLRGGKCVENSGRR